MYKIGKRISPFCIYVVSPTTLHHVLQCTLTSAYHVKKHEKMSLRDWFTYKFDRSVSPNRVIHRMHSENNEFLFKNHIPCVDYLVQSSSLMKITYVVFNSTFWPYYYFSSFFLLYFIRWRLYYVVFNSSFWLYYFFLFLFLFYFNLLFFLW